MPEKVLVTGGAGFIGSHTVDALVATGYEVVVADNLTRGYRENVNSAATFYRLDIRDADKLAALFSDERPNMVIHLAALVSVQESIRQPIGYTDTNVIGTIRVLDECCRNGVRKFVFASSGGAVYGNPIELPATEACLPCPRDPYGASKLAAEAYVEAFSIAYGLPYCILRYANVYGPRQDARGEAGVINVFASKLLRKATPIINGDGRQTRDFVYVDDVARANLLALEAEDDTYNIGTGVATSINQVYNLLVHYILGRAQAEQHGPGLSGEVRNTYLDTWLARRALGWTAETELSEGLVRTVTYLRDQLAK